MVDEFTSPADFPEEEGRGSGCLSAFAMPPLVVILIASLLGAWAWNGSSAFAAKEDAARTAPLSPVFTAEVRFWEPSIFTWAEGAGLDPNLVATVIQIESCGNPFALSRAGAIGLFQVMPYHFARGEDAYAPDLNARRGLDYLRRSLDASRNEVRLALAGYNGGISLISAAEWSWPAETVRYAYWGGGIYAQAVGGESRSPRLEEWLRAGGAALCRNAAYALGAQSGN